MKHLISKMAWPEFSSKLFFAALVFCFSLFTFYSSMAQLPETEIYLVDMKVDNGNYTFGEPVNITNHKGYDNQPAFSPKGEMLYYVSMVDGKQTDLMIYSLSDNKTTQVTNTPESEYSPQPLRGTELLNMIRVDKDSSQHVYRYNRVGKNPVLLTPENDSIGYHVWLGDSHLALYVIGKKPTLQVYDLNTHKYDTVAQNIGRCIQSLSYLPAVYFTQKTSDSTWTIEKYELSTKSIDVMGDCMTGSEDFALTRDGKVFTSKNGKLYMMNPNGNRDWKQIADFSKTVGNFYRIAISTMNNKIAIVGYAGKKP